MRSHRHDGARAMNAMLCESLISPVDVSPIRSPMAVHSFLAPRFAGKDLIEIGTRSGDGMACYARLARHATAIELSERYCKELERRSRALAASHTLATFNVTCRDYRQAATLDADVVTWWEQPPLRNAEVLLTLHNELLYGRLRPTAEAVLLFDPKYPSDLASFHGVCPLATWSARIVFDEHESCIRAVREGTVVSKHRDAARRLCDRARGFFIAAGVPISDRRIPRHVGNGSSTWAGGSRREREHEWSSCVLRHEAGWSGGGTREHRVHHS